MELQPQQFVVGVVTPPVGVPGGPDVNPTKLNLIWSEVSPHYGYRQYQLAPDGTGAVFLGSAETQQVAIQPPVIQIRDPIELTSGQSAEKAEAILKIIARHLGIAQFFNLGIRLIYHAPAPDNDATGYLMRNVLQRSEDDLAELRAGDAIWGGVKIGTGNQERQYSLVIEPLHRDARFIYVDLDAQFPGPATLDAVTTRAKDVEQYLTHAVNSFLDRTAG